MAETRAPTIDWRRDLRGALTELKNFSRRGFFTLLGLITFAVASLVAGVLSLRFVIPNVTYDQPLVFKAGMREDFPVGSTTVFADQRTAINHDVDGFYALSMICTHLGCTVRWFQTDAMFRCPCHGSRYLRDGVRFFGPAPRPLERYKLTQSPDGSLLVDRGKLVSRSYRLVVS